MKLLRIVALFAALFAFVAPQAFAAAGDPAARKIENFYATLVDTMKRGPSLGMKGRYQALAPAVDSTFDIPTMIKFVVGPSWATMSESDHKQLIEAFRRMTIADYANNFDSYDGEHFDVDPNVETKGGDVFVQTTLVPKNDKPIPFIYRMRNMGGEWKAIDVYLNGYVDQLTTKRSDFASTLESGGAAALAKKLNSLADTALAGTKS
ncbi:MAG TPA: ABC transporter substrate-binding protein [Rhizomicrobium sp.]|nr:ABC transporter substrate-binding protein [Rhizomicrobium sp.]